jgi:hypothetical protein
MIETKKDFLWKRTFVLHCVFYFVFLFSISSNLYIFSNYYKCYIVIDMDSRWDFVWVYSLISIVG